MSVPEASGASSTRKAGISRRLAIVLSPFVCLVGFPLVHGVVPWALSLLGPWYGWADGNPAVWNLFGLVPVAIGIVVLLWLTIVGFTYAAQLPERVELNWDPKV